MKNNNIFNFIVTLILLPLWLGLVTDFIKQIPWLHYIVTGILTVLMLLYLALTIHELRIKLDAHFNFQRWRMDRLIRRTRMKLRRIIARTNNPSVLDYANDRLREICPPEVYAHIFENQGKRGQKQYNIDLLQTLNKQTGGANK